MDINTTIKRIIATGKVGFGSKKAVKAIMSGKAKLIITSQNCPKRIKEDIDCYSKISKTPTIIYPGTSLDLGEVCGKPFLVSNITVFNPGDVKIKELIGAIG